MTFKFIVIIATDIDSNKVTTHLLRIVLGKDTAIFKLAQNVLESFAGV